MTHTDKQEPDYVKQKKEMMDYIEKLVKESKAHNQHVIYPERNLHPFQSDSLNEFATKIRTE